MSPKKSCGKRGFTPLEKAAPTDHRGSCGNNNSVGSLTPPPKDSRSTRSLTGFTLLEIIIGVAIFSVIAVVVGSVLVGHYKIYDFASTDGDLKAASLTILERMAKVAAESKEIALSHNFGGADFTAGSSTAIFALPAEDASGNIIADAFDYIAFYKSPTSTKVIEYAEAAAGSVRKSGTKILSAFVKNLIFSYNNNVPSASTDIKIFLEIEKTVRGTIKNFRNSATVYLRNK